MQKTAISWVLGSDGKPGYTWNPLAGCSPASPGCTHCYAKRLAATRLAHLPAYKGLAYVDDSEDTDRERVVDRYRWTGEVRFFPEKLVEPFRLRKPSGIFVGDMGDIGLLPFEQIAASFAVAAACPHHRFYFLTKRPGRLRACFEWLKTQDKSPALHLAWELLTAERESVGDSGPIHCKYGPNPDAPWPLPNAWIGTSVCTRADLGNIDELRKVPAAMRFVSFEPLLEDLGAVFVPEISPQLRENLPSPAREPEEWAKFRGRRVDWGIVGGESGPHARPFNVEWMRSLNRQCEEAGVARWNKQLGASPMVAAEGCVTGYFHLRDRAGADPSEWPADLRYREMPEAKP